MSEQVTTAIEECSRLEAFEHRWTATILRERPLILPRRRYVYPREVEEIERGALELLVQPYGPGDPDSPENPERAKTFLATCALGFADPLAPTGVWSCPNPGQLCAVAGGYAYLIDTREPQRFEQVAYRPVLAVYAVPESTLLLFVGNQRVVAYNALGQAWESLRLSDEGIQIDFLADGQLHGKGWIMASDTERSFSLNLLDGTMLEGSL